MNVQKSSKKYLQLSRTVLMDVVTQFKEAEISLSASSLAYTTILSIIPLLAVSFSVFKAFGGLDQLYGALEPFIFENLAEGSDEETLGLIRQFIGNIHAGALGATGFIGLIFTSMSMLFSVEKTLNRVWKAKSNRSWFSRISTYWLFITLGPLALSFAVGVGTSQQLSITQMLPSGTGLFILLVGLFFSLYRFVPEKTVNNRAALLAALWTAAGWMIAKAAYSIYVKKVLTYSKIYGSLGAIPIFLLWIYLGWLVILTGAALSAALQRRFENV
jgi:membrane protein